MQVLRIFDLIPRKALVARATARQIASAVETALGTSGEAIELDFSGVEAVTPSFIDEILGVIQHIVDQSGLALEKSSYPILRHGSRRNSKLSGEAGTFMYRKDKALPG